jgi:UDP-glucuronate 4-epimerase
MKRIFITGTSGFIGFHLAKFLLDQGFIVHGYDGMTDYYDVSLKQARTDILNGYDNFSSTTAMLENIDSLSAAVKECAPHIIVHLAGQAGVRYSIDNPRSYLESNIVGTFNILEVARDNNVKHLMMASTSSVYGATRDMPYHEMQKVDTQMSFYAATKKANESMAHSWANVYNVPITMFRFFTVYGPWGRPDMALFKFTKGILEDTPIDIYNNGKMYRDFTYVGDLVRGISMLMDVIPDQNGTKILKDTLSPVAPFRVVNIGNSEKVLLLDFIEAIEEMLQKKALRNYMPMQLGDVLDTWADATLLKDLTGYAPSTDVRQGVCMFVEWYKSYYKI